jgi:uncharacterized damage-inducible protein DinB
MTKPYYIELAQANKWANDIVINWCNNINDEQWLMELASSFNGIGKTVLHIAGAEQVWHDRLNLVEAPVWLPSVYTGGKEELIKIWQQASDNLISFVNDFDENRLQENLSFKRINGDAQYIKHYQVFSHVFNHSTYHRGQLVTLFRQAGYTSVGSTDLLTYYRLAQ